MKLKTIVQLCPKLTLGGIERGVVDIAVHLQKIGYSSIVISNGGRLVSELENHRVTHIQLPIHSKNPLYFIMNLWRLNQLIRQLKPDLLLPYSRVPSWLVYWLCKKNKIPFITHCLGIHRMGSLGLKTKYNSVLLQGDRIIANSFFTKSYFLHHYPLCQKNISVVHRSVDTEVFKENNGTLEVRQSVRDNWKVAPDQIVILLPARMSYWKGHDVLLSAFYLMKQAGNTNFYVVMMRDSETNSTYYRRITAKIIQLNLSNKVYFEEPSTNIRNLYIGADIILSASTEPEAFGRTIIEAQAMGKIVVASAHGGALETIEDNISGFLVAPGNPKELAHMLIQIQKLDAIKLAEISKNAIKHAQNFSKETMCEHLVEIYHELIGES